MLLQPDQQPGGLLHSALAQAQVRQAAQDVGPDLLVFGRKTAQGRHERVLGLRPPSGGHEETSVVRSAVPADRGQPPALRDLVGRTKPLLGPDDVVGPLAHVEEPAENALRDGEVADLPCTDGGKGLVEEPQAPRQPGKHQHDPQRGERLALEIGITAPAGHVDRC